MSRHKLNYENNKTKGLKIKVYCSQCNTITNHEVMQSFDVEGKESIFLGMEDYGTIDWNDSYQIIKCQGCDEITFRSVNWCSERVQQIGPDEWEDGEIECLYPNRSINTRIEKASRKLPRSLQQIYTETIDCFNNESLILCAAGLRAIIEGVCSEQQIKDGPVFQEDGITPVLHKDGTTPVRKNNLEGKIAGLHEKGFLTKTSADTLHEHRFLGNEAIHELQAPTKEILSLALDIIEHLLEDLYEIPDKADALRQKRGHQSVKNK